MSKKLQAHIALFVVAAVYGSNYLIAKGLMPDLIGPSGFIVARILGAVLLFGILYALNYEKVERKDLARLALCGLTGVALNQLMFFNGLNLTSPVNASIIMTSNPILVLVASSLLLGAKITKRKAIGVAIGAAGAALLILQGSSDKDASILGDIFVLVNALSYGIYLVVVKPLMSKYKSITVIFWVFVFGAIMAIPVGAQQFLAIDWSQFTPQNWLSLSFVVLCVTFLVYLLNIFALKIVMPSVVAVYIYLQPIMVAFFSAIAAYMGATDYTGDITWERIGCAILIFVGVYLVSFSGKIRPARPA